MGIKRWFGPLSVTFGVVLGATALLATPAIPGNIPASLPAHTAATGPAPAPALSRAEALDRYGKLPINFEPNVGQADAGIQYVARGAGYAIGLTGQSVLLGVQAKAKPSTRGPHQAMAAPGAGAQLRLSLVHAKAHPKLAAERPQPGRSNYLVGQDRMQWHTNIPNFGAVRYSDVYPGVDWVVYGNPQQLEYDLVVAPHADAGQIRLRVDGADGLRVDGNGDLVVAVQGREIRQLKPVVYQALENGERRSVDGRYKLDAKSRQVAFELGDYDHARALTIDPAVVYATYIGGSGDEGISAVRVDGAGYVYLAGATGSTNFPFTNSIGPIGTYLAFVAKINPAGTAFVYSTVLGGKTPVSEEAPATSGASDVVVDSDGNAYLGGSTGVSDFPVVNPVQATNPDFLGGAAFLAKLDPSGSTLIYSTYLGGSGQNGSFSNPQCGDGAGALALDAARNLYATGGTCSNNFPTVHPLQASRNSFEIIGFVTKLSPDGGTLLFSTYLGGSGSPDNYGTSISGVAVNADGIIYAAGITDATDFPVTANAFQSAQKGETNGFLVKIDPVTPTLLYGSYFGGSGADYIRDMALDASGNVYLVGVEGSTDFPTTAGVIETAKGGGTYDGFVSKLAPASGGGFSLAYSTYLGGVATDSVQSVAVDAAGDAYVAGVTSSVDFPASGTGGATLPFLSKLNPAGTALLYSVVINNNSFTPGRLALDSSGNAYVAGYATSGMQVLNSMQTYGGGAHDAALMKLSASQATSPAPTASLSFSPATIQLGASSTLSWTNANASGCALTDSTGKATTLSSLTGSITVTPTAGGSYTYADSCGSGGGYKLASATLTVQGPPPGVNITVSPSSIAVGGSATLSWTATGVDSCTASGAWSGSHPTSGTLNVSPSSQGTYTYTLGCQGSSVSYTGSAVLTVGTPSSSSSSSSGGGSSSSSSSGAGSSGSSSGGKSSSSSSSSSSGSSSSSSGGATSSSSSSSGGPSSSSSSSSSGGGGGGGGGAFGATALLPLLLGAALRRRRRHG